MWVILSGVYTVPDILTVEMLVDNPKLTAPPVKHFDVRIQQFYFVTLYTRMSCEAN